MALAFRLFLDLVEIGPRGHAIFPAFLPVITLRNGDQFFGGFNFQGIPFAVTIGDAGSLGHSPWR